MGIRSFAAELLPSALNLRLRGLDVDALPATSPTSFAELSERLGYLSKAEVKQVREAYKFAD